MDVRASDLLQANSIVWVEGPSDRLYINKWIELWTDGKIKEGIHYQCMFYGGRLLAHISADSPEEAVEPAVAILSINRNAAVIIDSDKDTLQDSINATKERIVEEIIQIDGITWITDGKEIENYIPSEVLSHYYSKPNLPALGRFEKISDYLDRNVGPGIGDKFKSTKVELAADICDILTKEQLQADTALANRLDELCGAIKRWNRLE